MGEAALPPVSIFHANHNALTPGSILSSRLPNVQREYAATLYAVQYDLES